jgi:hypothetical protein
LTCRLRSTADGSVNALTDTATPWNVLTKEGLVRERIEIGEAFDETVIDLIVFGWDKYTAEERVNFHLDYYPFRFVFLMFIKITIDPNVAAAAAESDSAPGPVS